LYSDVDLLRWINISRGQLAGEAACIRVHGTLATVASQRSYAFSAINTGVSATTGVQGVINVSSLSFVVGSGQKWMTPRTWPWFSLYNNNNPVPQNGVPTEWAQFGQGAANTGTGSGNSGTIFLDPTPDDVYSISCNAVCYPIALVDDTTVEAIPYLWTDAVPWFAASYALWSAQNNARMADAERYFNTYTMFVERARKFSNPDVNRWMYSQAGDPAQAGKMQIGGGGKPGGA
jgi:hypothetical protein